MINLVSWYGKIQDCGDKLGIVAWEDIRVVVVNVINIFLLVQ